MQFLHLTDDCLKLGGLVPVNPVTAVITNDLAVRRNLDDIELVNLMKLFTFSHGRTSHTGKLVIETEIVLERNGCKCHGLFLHFDAFFCLYSLVKPLVVTTPRQQATSELIDNDNLSVICHHIVFVALKQRLRPQCLL